MYMIYNVIQYRGLGKNSVIVEYKKKL